MGAHFIDTVTHACRITAGITEMVFMEVAERGSLATVDRMALMNTPLDHAIINSPRMRASLRYALANYIN